ncbi:MAG TPA: hypothetical protein VLU91_02840 [Nitrososphaerales archaeon]|nr:hypothetical protein [Nitrososphaerales archaeon]
MSSGGRVKVVVKSRRVPIRSLEVSHPVFTPSGMLVGATKKRVVVYGFALDEGYRRAIEEGNRLSSSLGLELEVVDTSKSGLLRRVLSHIQRRSLALPTFMVTPLETATDGGKV